MLKIIAGSVKGRSLQTVPKSFNVRPILARIKKSLFDILSPKLPGCRFLDVYAGTGSVGIEALSRGAAHTSFVEQDRVCVNVIQKNLDILGFGDKGVVYRGNALEDLSFLPKPYDLIFLGPPYVDDQKQPLYLVMPTLKVVHQGSLLAENGVLIAQHHKKEKVEATPEWDLFRQESYGDSILSFYRRPR